MNLLTNAAQAMTGRAGARITLRTRRQEGQVVIQVADNGPGIPPEILSRIFDPFFTTKDVGEGTGLGLSIVHGIVERHGGTIEVESEVGKGTTFTVTLPVEQPIRPAQPSPGQATPRA
jgi:signal transduction histidine kinase